MSSWHILTELESWDSRIILQLQWITNGSLWVPLSWWRNKDGFLLQSFLTDPWLQDTFNCRNSFLIINIVKKLPRDRDAIGRSKIFFLRFFGSNNPQYDNFFKFLYPVVEWTTTLLILSHIVKASTTEY